MLQGTFFKVKKVSQTPPPERNPTTLIGAKVLMSSWAGQQLQPRGSTLVWCWSILIRVGEQKTFLFSCVFTSIMRELVKKTHKKALQWSLSLHRVVFLPIFCCWLLLSVSSAICGRFCHVSGRQRVPKTACNLSRGYSGEDRHS